MTHKFSYVLLALSPCVLIHKYLHVAGLNLGLGFEDLALTSASVGLVPKLWGQGWGWRQPQPQPWPQSSGLGFGLDVLASFNITAINRQIPSTVVKIKIHSTYFMCILIIRKFTHCLYLVEIWLHVSCSYAVFILSWHVCSISRLQYLSRWFAITVLCWISMNNSCVVTWG